MKKILTALSLGVFLFMNQVSNSLQAEESAQTVILESGLQYTDDVVGTGDTAEIGNIVNVHYIGTLTNKTKFDSSRDRGETFEFKLGEGQVIKGWEEGIKGMKVGGRRTLIIPADLAYGSRQVGDIIPANATLVFDVELISLKK